MRIQINSDKNVVADAQLASLMKGDVNRVLKRFTHKLTRVEVHLSDVNSHKPGPLDKRCLVEARPARHWPLTASSRAAKIEGASSVPGVQERLRHGPGRLLNQHEQGEDEQVLRFKHLASEM